MCACVYVCCMCYIQTHIRTYTYRACASVNMCAQMDVCVYQIYVFLSLSLDINRWYICGCMVCVLVCVCCVCCIWSTYLSGNKIRNLALYRDSLSKSMSKQTTNIESDHKKSNAYRDSLQPDVTNKCSLSRSLSLSRQKKTFFWYSKCNERENKSTYACDNSLCLCLAFILFFVLLLFPSPLLKPLCLSTLHIMDPQCAEYRRLIPHSRLRLCRHTHMFDNRVVDDV